VTCAEHLRLRANHNATIIEIKVLKTHLKSLQNEHTHLLNAYSKLKKEEIARLAEKTEQEIFDVGTRLQLLKQEFPSAFKEA